MTPRLVGGIAAGAFAVGILTGAAGTIVARDASTPQTNFAAVMADHMGGQGTGSMMGTGIGSMMGPDSSVPGTNGMMSGSMMVPSGPGMMSPGSSITPDASSLPDGGHDSHHPVASPEGTSR
jgi:hypothetical protein